MHQTWQEQIFFIIPIFASGSVIVEETSARPPGMVAFEHFVILDLRRFLGFEIMEILEQRGRSFFTANRENERFNADFVCSFNFGSADAMSPALTICSIAHSLSTFRSGKSFSFGSTPPLWAKEVGLPVVSRHERMRKNVAHQFQIAGIAPVENRANPALHFRQRDFVFVNRARGAVMKKAVVRVDDIAPPVAMVRTARRDGVDKVGSFAQARLRPAYNSRTSDSRLPQYPNIRQAMAG